jgi:uncharacterized protein (TIGR00645 family)
MADERSRRDRFETGLERTIFASRWLLAPMYIGLIAGLAMVTVKFFTEMWLLFTTFRVDHSAETMTVSILTLIDIALLGNLILIVIFAGYENFVSKIHAADDSEDRPTWMGHVDFSGLKMKLIGSLVAISVILLLKDFVAAGAGEEEMDYTAVGWRIGLHFTFVLSGLIFAIMDYWGAKRLKLLSEIEHRGRKPVDLEPLDPNAQ